MKVPGSGLHIDSPSFPLLRALISYGGGLTTAAGAATGLTLVCADLANEPSYRGQLIKILSGDAAGQVRKIVNDSSLTGTVVFDQPVTDRNGAVVTITASTLFDILSVGVDGQLTGATSPFFEQADVAFNIGANLGEQDILNLATANTRYIVRHLRLKCVDPVAETVTVRLYELVNDVLTLVDSFVINTTNYLTYYSLMDMFGIPYLAGDQLQVTVIASAVGPYAVTGNYSWAKTNV